jgi:acetoin utilization deacetylase AcuC-like enzyme
MKTLLFTHPDCLLHRPPSGHPERPERLQAVIAALSHIEGLGRRDAPLATDAQIARLHPLGLIQALEQAAPESPHAHPVAIDPDTWLSAGTMNAARRAAGAALAAVDAVMTGEAEAAFCAVRPPGHHAEPARPMGFCLFNSAALAALHAREAHGAQRVALVDFDVHHGNGSEAAFRGQEGLLYASIHQSPLYPGTGDPADTGADGEIANVTFAPGAGAAAWRAAVETKLLPRLEAFAPDMLIVSAGFDAHRDDPLANGALLEADYAWITGELAARAANRRLVSVLEGGYDLDALGRSAAAHVRALMDA